MADDGKDRIGPLIGDLAGMGKLGETLLGMIAGAVRGLAAPMQTRRIGYAETDVQVDRAVRLADAEALSEAIKRGDLSLRDRAASRLLSRELAHQQNLEAVIIRSVEVLKNDGDFAAEEPSAPDADWMDAYFRYAENVSNDHVQDVWARVLAGQISDRRRSISLATLDSLRLLEPRHAVAFRRLVQGWSAFGALLDISLDDGSDADFSVYTEENLALQGLGLIEIVAKREYYLQGKGYALVFGRAEDSQVDGIAYNDVDFVQVRPSWRGLELCDVLFPGLIEWDPRADGHVAQPDLGPWASVGARARVLAHWVDVFASMTAQVHLGHHANMASPRTMYVRSESVFTHVWARTVGWREVGAGDVASYPSEVRRLLDHVPSPSVRAAPTSASGGGRTEAQPVLPQDWASGMRDLWWSMVCDQQLGSRPTLVATPYVLLHVVPELALQEPVLNPRSVTDARRAFFPEKTPGVVTGADSRQWWSHGPRRKQGDLPNEVADWCVRLRRPGVFEESWTLEVAGDEHAIDGRALEQAIIAAIERGLGLCSAVGLGRRSVAGVIIYGLDGLRIRDGEQTRSAFAESSLILPTSIVGLPAETTKDGLADAFDVLWLSSGFDEGSPSY